MNRTKHEMRNLKRETGGGMTPDQALATLCPSCSFQRSAFRVQRSKGFTLIEMIVVVGIIALLMSLLMAAVVRSRAYAEKMSIQVFLGHVSSAIDGYYTDFNFYPDSSSTNGYGGTLTSGSARLAEALTGYINNTTASGKSDGAGTNVNAADPLYGFRMTPGGNGRIYGPYMKVDATNYVAASASDQYFTDPLGQRILYFKASGNAAATKYFDPAGSASIFNTADNPIATYGDPTTAANKLFLTLLGNTGAATPANAGNNTINAGETPINQQTYLLVSPGINGAASSNNWYVGGTGLYDSVVNSN